MWGTEGQTATSFCMAINGRHSKTGGKWFKKFKCFKRGGSCLRSKKSMGEGKKERAVIRSEHRKKEGTQSWQVKRKKDARDRSIGPT